MSQNTIHLQCKSCGGNLDIDRNQSLIFCPFCGSRELLIDSDAVAVEKIRQQTEFKKWEREDLQQQREENEKYKNSKAGNVALVFAIICGLMFVGSVTIIRSVPNFLRSLSLLLQTASFLSQMTRLNFLLRFTTSLVLRRAKHACPRSIRGNSFRRSLNALPMRRRRCKTRNTGFRCAGMRRGHLKRG